MKIKNKEMKREKRDFPQWFFFWRTIDGREIIKKNRETIGE